MSRGAALALLALAGTAAAAPPDGRYYPVGEDPAEYCGSDDYFAIIGGEMAVIEGSCTFGPAMPIAGYPGAVYDIDCVHESFPSRQRAVITYRADGFEWTGPEVTERFLRCD